METSNETLVVGLVPRAIAVALAFLTTCVISVGVTAIVTGTGAELGSRAFQLAVAPLEAAVRIASI